MKFRIGDVCEIRPNAHPREYAGMECTIVSDEDVHYHAGRNAPWVAYTVRLSNGDVGRAEGCALRLKRPPCWDKWLFDTTPVEGEKSAAEIANAALLTLGAPA